MSGAGDEDKEFTAAYYAEMDPMPDSEADRLGQKLLAKVKTEACPFCGNADWWVLDRKRAISRLVMSGGYSVEVYTLSCSTCGFIRQHLRDTVDQ